MKRTFKGFLAAAAGLLLLALGSLSPAHAATYQCDQQGVGGTTYPLDSQGHAYRCKNLTTGVLPSDSRTVDLFTSLSSTAVPNNVKNKLKAANVKYFFFNNRAEANDYFSQTSPYNSGDMTLYTPFVSTVSRCAQTGFGSYAPPLQPSVKIIVVAIYDNCQYDSIPLQVQNPSLRRTAFHETGHAFDFSLASTGSNVPSSRAGFTTLFNSDKNLLTPSNWASYSTGSKYNYICNLFSYSIPSALEKDLGANNNGGPGGQVCQTNNTPYTYYQTKTPTQIAPEKLPYFTSSNQEIWAESFVVLIDGNTSPASFLPITDRVIGQNQSPIRSFNCVRGVVNAYVNTLTAPPVSSTTPGVITLTNLGCNTSPGPL